MRGQLNLSIIGGDASVCLLILKLVSSARSFKTFLKRSFSMPLDAQFSPDGQFIAITHGKQIQFWRTPGFHDMEFAPMVLHRTLAGPFDDVLSIKWSPDSKCKDMTVRVFSTDPIEGFEPSILTGHREAVLGAWFSVDAQTIYSVSKDGSLFVWKYKTLDSISSQTSAPDAKKRKKGETAEPMRKWVLTSRQYFNQNHAKVVSCDFHANSNLLVVGFTSGVFGIWELPDFINIHTLSISQKKLDAVTISPSGEWLAFGSSRLGQLLVWEWKSESYVLKQQGHNHEMNCLSYSPDGQYVVTGGDDGKVKLWNTQTGFCFVTFPEHSASIQAVEFSKRKANVVFSASLDGTVRAFDLVRYRNFRTFTSPTHVQFGCIAVDPSGDVVCAGSVDTFEVFMWSVQTGQLLEVLSGHTGPVSCLAFSPIEGRLVSGSWDRSLRTWNLFNRDSSSEPFTHQSEILALAYRGDGKEVAVATLDGQITIWDVELHRQVGTIEGKKDVGGGRKVGDRVTAANNSNSKYFTSLCYTVDGSCLLAGGNSKYVCIYDVKAATLLRKFQISHNLSLDGMHVELDSRNMTEAGPRELIDDTGDMSDIEDRRDDSLPGAKKGDLSLRSKTRPEARTKCVRFAPSGRTWAAASTEGLLLYSLDDAIMFDPFDLEIDITPESILAAVDETKEYLRALVMSFRLGEKSITKAVFERTPVASVNVIVKGLPHKYLEKLIKFLVERMDTTQSVQLNLTWSLGILRFHGQYLKDRSQEFAGPLRGLVKGISKLQDVLAKVTNGNINSLRFLTSQMALAEKSASKAAATTLDEVVMEELF
ncbi:putative WD repeat protein [Chytriomyces sp. MP71]|nr:putative WD repeat protein [Chytriomyces sp. MP71]